MKSIVIVPAYNEEHNLPELLQRLRDICPEYDVVVVNDCSYDNTLKICNDFGVDVINLPVNLGIGGAVQAGYIYARYKGYDFAVQVDGDGQHDPKFIKLLFSELEKGASICVGSRFISGEGFQSSRLRRLGIKYFSSLIYLFTGQRIKDPTSGFRACDKNAIKLFSADYPRDYPEPESLVNAAKHNLKISEIPVIMHPRAQGKSSITNIKSVYYMIKVTLAIIIASIYYNKSKEAHNYEH